jgi:hypothetical protein
MLKKNPQKPFMLGKTNKSFGKSMVSKGNKEKGGHLVKKWRFLP